MHKISWKTKARSGGVRRRVLKQYLKIMNSDTVQPTISSLEGYQSATVPLSEKGSVDNNIPSFINIEEDECENQLRCSKEDHQSAAIHFSEVSSIHDKNCNNVAGSTLDDEYDSKPFSSSSDESDTYDAYAECQKQLVFRKKIIRWAVENNISHAALKDLAGIINEQIPQILPKDPRSIYEL